MTSPIAPEARSVLHGLLRGREADAYATVAEVAAALPGRRVGKRMHARVIERWCVRGVRGHVLRSSRVGHRRVVRWGDLAEFLSCIARRDERTVVASDPPVPRLSAHRREVARRAATTIYEIRK